MPRKINRQVVKFNINIVIKKVVKISPWSSNASLLDNISE